MLRLKDFGSVVEHVYTAAAEPERWRNAIAHLCGLYDAPSAGLTLQDAGGSFGLRTLVGYHPGDDQLYFAQHAAQNLLFDRLAEQGIGRPTPTQRLVDDRALERTAYYAEWLKPRDIQYCLGVVLARERDTVQWLSINRPKSSGGFTSDDVRFLEMLTPHLQRAAILTRRLGALTAAKVAIESILDGMDQALVLLDARGRPLFENRKALSLAALNDGFGLEPRGVSGATVTVTAELTRIVAHAARNLDGLGRRGGTVALPRPSLLRPFIALVTPLAVDLGWQMAACPVVAVLIADPEQSRAVPERVLRVAFGLTHAEAKLAMLVAEGCDLSDAAGRMGIGHETARTHLARTLAKTGTRRQTQLIRLLASIAPSALHQYH